MRRRPTVAMPADPTLVLRPGVHAAVLGDDLVLLDVPADAYVCLPDVPGVRRGAGGLQAPSDSGLGDRLAEAGLLAEAGAKGVDTPGSPELPRPRRSAVADALPGPCWRDGAEALGCLLDLSRTYRGRPLAAILEAAARPAGQAAPDEAGPEVLAVVRRFRAWLPYAPVTGKCLLRSFMLLRLLRRRGLDACWVFGVRTWPFSAHCWLQIGDMVLDDHADRLVAYEPILVV